MVKNGVLRSTTNYVIEARKHPPSDLVAGLVQSDSSEGTVGEGIPIRCSSVEIISSLLIYCVRETSCEFQNATDTDHVLELSVSVYEMACRVIGRH